MTSDSLKLFRGDTNKINIAVRRKVLDSEGDPIRDTSGQFTYSPVDLTNAVLTLTARDKSNAVIFTVSTADDAIDVLPLATAGNAVATIPPEMTEDLKAPLWLTYDVQLVESDETKTTVAKGQMVVSKDVTY